MGGRLPPPPPESLGTMPQEGADLEKAPQGRNVDLAGEDLAVAYWTLEGFAVPSQAGAG